MKELLNCGSCELEADLGSMCGAVALRSLKEVAKIGYDTSSDSDAPGVIVRKLAATSPDVRAIAEGECQIRQLQHQSIQQGYGTVIY